MRRDVRIGLRDLFAIYLARQLGVPRQMLRLDQGSGSGLHALGNAPPRPRQHLFQRCTFDAKLHAQQLLHGVHLAGDIFGIDHGAT